MFNEIKFDWTCCKYKIKILHPLESREVCPCSTSHGKKHVSKIKNNTITDKLSTCVPCKESQGLINILVKSF